MLLKIFFNIVKDLIKKILKYKNIFAKRYAPNWSEEVFVVKKVKYTVPWTYEIDDLNGEEIMGSFMKKSYKRLIRKNLELKKRGDKLYVKWKGYDDSFNSWIDKKDFL